MANVFIMFLSGQTPMSLSEQASTALSPASQTQFQPVSKAPHSSGINVNAAPFQSMQTVRPAQQQCSTGLSGHGCVSQPLSPLTHPDTDMVSR